MISKHRGYEYSGSFYVKNDIVTFDGEKVMNVRSFMSALHWIFPDELVDEVAIRANHVMAPGNINWAYDVLVKNGKVVEPFPVFHDKTPWLWQCYRRNWGMMNTDTTEFRIFENI